MIDVVVIRAGPSGSGERAARAILASATMTATP